MLEHLSFSSINLFLECPETWKKVYLEGEKQEENDFMRFGKAIHSTIESYLCNKDYKLIDLWSEEFNKFTFNNPNKFYSSGKELLIRNEENFKNLTPMKIKNNFMIEQHFSFYIPGVEIPIVGYIDTILKDKTIIDFKTTTNQFNLENYWLQPLIYIRGAVENKIPVSNIFKFIVLSRTKYNFEVYTIQLEKSFYTEKLDKAMLDIWKQIQYSIKNNKFEHPAHVITCKKCGYKKDINNYF